MNCVVARLSCEKMDKIRAINYSDSEEEEMVIISSDIVKINNETLLNMCVMSNLSIFMIMLHNSNN